MASGMIYLSVLGSFHIYCLSGPYAQEEQGSEEIRDLSVYVVLFIEKCMRYSVSPLQHKLAVSSARIQGNHSILVKVDQTITLYLSEYT